MHEQINSATVKARARMGAVKIHGANSPEVLSGRVPEGFREEIETEGDKIIEVTREQAEAMWGKDMADSLFRGLEEEPRD
jgi:hypothetical protein